MSVSLWDLKNNFHKVLDFEVNGPEDAAAMIELLDEVQEDIEIKCVQAGYVVKTWAHEMEMLKAAEAELSRKRKVRENKTEWLKKYVFDAMKAAGIDKTETTDITVSIQKNPAALVIYDESKVPKEFWVEHEPTVNKAEFKKFVKDFPVDYAKLVQGESLRIK